MVYIKDRPGIHSGSVIFFLRPAGAPEGMQMQKKFFAFDEQNKNNLPVDK